jgi:hypothetical protein
VSRAIRAGSGLACVTALLLAGLAGAPGAAAQEAQVSAQVDARRIGVEDVVQYTLTVSGRADLSDSPKLPALENLRLVGGPSVSQQLSFVNGSLSQARSFTWALQPLAVGPAQIGPARVLLASGEKTAAAIAIEVVAGSQRPRARARGIDPFDPFGDGDPFEDAFGRARGNAPEPKLRVEVGANRQRLRVGEPLLVTYYVDTTVSISDVQFKEPPQYPGFWAEPLEAPPASNEGEAVSIDGTPGRRFAIQRRLLFPTKAGTLMLPPVTLALGLARRSIFDRGGSVERRGGALAVTVEPLPAGAEVTGAVGQFRLDARLDRATLALGDAATLRVEIAGRGNLKWVERGPEITIPGAKVYPPQVKSALEATPDGLTGSKTWEYVIVPETTGTLELPAVVFPYFDSTAGRLAEARSGALQLLVEGGTGAPALPLAAAGAGAARAPGNTGLALRNALDPTRPPLVPIGPLGVGALLVLALLGHLGLAFGELLTQRRRLATGRPRTGDGRRTALQELARVERAGLPKEQAAALIERALHDAFGPLAQDDADASEGARAARALLQELQFLRFAPQLGDYAEQIRALATRAQAVVRRWA